MPAQLSGLVGRVRATIGAFTLAQRTLALIGLAGLVLGAVALSAWAAKPTMTPLFTGLAASDASAIVDQLESEGVPYELADGGSSVMVPADDVYAMRLVAAAAGLPTASDGAGYSLLDDMGMTSSEFQQQVTYQRALEGELAKTIQSLAGVETATVRLALPEESVFVSETADPTASVFIKTKAGATVDSDKVQAIVHLVSAGIEGMDPTDVAVVDANGTVLSAVGGTQAGGMQGGQTAEYEARVASNVQGMLERIVGAGNAVVSVTADLDYDQIARTSETYTPAEGAPPSSAQTSVEEYTGGAEAGATGILGPDGQPQGAAGGEGEYRKESSTVNNTVNKTVEQLTSTPGAVRRQSVSVVVSADAGGALNMGDLQQAVVAAAGIDEARGDVVSVSRMAFDTTTAEAAQTAIAAAEAEAQTAQQSELIRTAAIAGIVLLALIAAAVMGARRSRRARREAIDLGAIELVEAAQRQVIEPEPEPAYVLPPARDLAADELAAKREDVMALAADQPAEVAEVLRGWLVGGRR
ncbi:MULTISPECIES: flagellar basal-body MS-ring/collar protein FliF [unclassified Actinotalea]|uniref:flagellar basal-body MS-ring/collar protein FliF n=1 Tax=unclassified Actinotalea TaxID=2638618 RepID=UPI0015F3B7BC|nr:MULTISPECIES: flagellar basal-body MS-ring/collar protein FliF [unclassified Actinotalea]